jgi:hypothetical protein
MPYQNKLSGFETHAFLGELSIVFTLPFASAAQARKQSYG